MINVLIVDDHPESLLALEGTLAGGEYNIVKASSGNEALRMMLLHDFALILLDVRMPDCSGFDIARLVRQREKNRFVPILFVSGFYKDTESIAEGYMAGAVDYLLKPVDPDIIRAKCSFLIDLYLKNESIKQTGKYYEALMHMTKVIVWRADVQPLHFTYVSKEAEKLLGYPITNWTKNESWMECFHPEDFRKWISTCERAVQLKVPQECEQRIITKDGKTLWFQNMFRVPESQSISTELVGIMVDITDRKESEEVIRKANEELELRIADRTIELRRMLEEKEILLKEIHHRVKNNLQIISSLLKLQRRHSKNHDGLDALAESEHRVLSMALIHEKLYETTNFTEIDFASYTTELASHLLNSYGMSAERIRLNVRSDVQLSMDCAIPCGLIVNELVSNALKHAFGSVENGEIEITLYKNNADLTLMVRDNGTGFPKDQDLQGLQSLGLKLVHTLARQLRGKIEIQEGPGAGMRITFPEPKPSRSIAV